MKIALLSIGDELLFGETVDTNASHIAARLYASGFSATQHRTVGDSEGEIATALTELAKTHDVLIATGGLGPTSDDVTAAAAAAASGDTLVVNRESLAHMHAFLGRRGKELYPANEKQAILPSSASILPNNAGTACGFSIEIDRCTLFFLPGVPFEMKAMLDESVLPKLVARGEALTLRTAVLQVFGLSEAKLEETLKTAQTPEVTIAYCVAFPTIKLLLRTSGINPARASEALDLATRNVMSLVGEYVIGDDGATLESEVSRLLLEAGLTIAVAESCSGGLLAKRLTDIPGSSSYMLAGLVTYANLAKTRLLGVSPKLLDAYGAVSKETAAAMAEGVRLATGSDLSMAVTGIAGPAGGTPEKPVGTVYLALSQEGETQTRYLLLSGNRDQIRELTVCHALDWVRRHLSGASHDRQRTGT